MCKEAEGARVQRRCSSGECQRTNRHNKLTFFPLLFRVRACVCCTTLPLRWQAEKTVDGTFDGIEADYKAVGNLTNDVLKDVTGIVTGLTTLSNAAASLAVHMHQAEPMLRAGLGASETDAGANAQEVAALQATLARFYDTQKLVTRRIVAATVQDMKHNAYEPLSGVSDGHPNMLHVAKAVEQRNKAQLDFDAIRRTSQSQSHITAAHEHYTAASQDAEDALRAGTAERYATAVATFSAVLRALTKFYGDANTVMNAMSKDVAALGTVPAAYRNKDKPEAAQKAPQRATPTPAAAPKTQTASSMFDTPAATQSPKPARSAPVTVFDILDGTAPSQQGQSLEPQGAKPTAGAATAAAQPSNSALFDIDGMLSQPSTAAPPQFKSALDDFFGGPTSTASPAPSGSPSAASAADSFGDFGAPLQPTPTATAGATVGSGSSVDMLFGATPVPTPTPGAGNANSPLAMFGSDFSLDRPSSAAGAGPSGPALPEDDSHDVLPTKQDVERWSTSGGRVSNLRALLASMHTVLWPGAPWKPVSLAELVDVQQVKDAYKRAFLVVHPDKVVGPRRQELARMIFAILREAYDNFKKEVARQQAAAAAATRVNPHAGDVD